MRSVALPIIVAILASACGGPGEPRRTIAGADLERGRALTRTYGCGACHSIPGVSGARGKVGPPLSGVADRAYIGGVLPNTDADMMRWLRNPRAVDPRTVMPNMGVTDRDARDITAYLLTLRAEPTGTWMTRDLMERTVSRERPAEAAPTPRGPGR